MISLEFSSLPVSWAFCSQSNELVLTEKEAHTTRSVDIGYESSADGADTEAKRDNRNEPAWADPLAGHVAWNLKDDV